MSTSSLASLVVEVSSDDFVFNKRSVENVTSAFVLLVQNSTTPDPPPDREFGRVHAVLSAAVDQGEVDREALRTFVRRYSLASRIARFEHFCRERAYAQEAVDDAHATAAHARALPADTPTVEKERKISAALRAKARAEAHLREVSALFSEAEVDRMCLEGLLLLLSFPTNSSQVPWSRGGAPSMPGSTRGLTRR